MESKPQIPAPRSVSGDDPASARIGPYHVVRHLVSGPGAQLLEAAADSGEQVLLQIVRCRAARSASEEAERREMIEAIRSSTDDLGKDFPLLQHGHAEADGETILYWALPWDDRAVELGLAKIDDDDDLVSVGIHLAKRLAFLHAKDRLDPLLSERIIVIQKGEPWVPGIPLRVPDKWLSPGMRAARLAPEETLAREPTRAGDVWRLGQALKALTVYLERLPTRVWRALELLGHPDVGVRVRSADEAMSMMEALADPLSPDPPSISNVTSAQAPGSIERTIADARLPDDDVATIADEPVASGSRRLLDDHETEPGVKPPRRMRVAEADTLIDVPRDEAEQVVIIEPSYRSSAPGLPASSLGDEAPTVGTQPVSKKMLADNHPTLDEAAIPPMRKKRASWDSGKSERNAGPTGTAPGAKPPSDLTVKRSTTMPGARRIEPAALPRMLPPPGGGIAGPKGTLVGASPIEPRQIMRVPRVTIPEEEKQEEPLPSEPREEIAEAPEDADQDVRIDPVPSPRNAAIAVLTFIAGLLIGAVASKVMRWLDDDRGLLAPVMIIPSSNLVRLDAEPPSSAVIVSEEDGQILGSPPLWFQVASGQEIAMLVAAPGHDPVRVVLPERGRLSVVLEPKSSRELCQVNLHVPQNMPIEGVAATIEEGSGSFSLPGAAVIRTTGELKGAWLLRCPNLGSEDVVTLPGHQVEREVELRISNPPDMEVLIDGQSAGTSPMRKRVATGLRHIQLRSAKGDSIERWVPVFSDAEIEFPYPN